MNVNQIENTIDALMEPYHGVLKAPRAARRLLRDLYSNHPREVCVIAVPIACKLTLHRGWTTRVRIHDIVEYCKARLAICEMLRPLRNEVIDPEAEYLCGMLINLHQKFWSESPKRSSDGA